MPTNDRAFKRLIEAFPAQLTHHFGRGARFIRMRNIELSREPMRVDALLEIRLPPKRTHELLHLEVQTKHDPQLPPRLCLYDTLIWQREGKMVTTCVIYLEPCQTSTSPWYMDDHNGERGITYRFDVVRLWQESATDWLATGLAGLMPFVPLLQGATPALLAPAINVIQQVPEPAAREDTLNYLFMFAARTFGRRTLLDYLRRNPIMEEYIQESPWYQEILHRGAEQGKVEGRTEGRTEGQAEMLKSLWEERFGPVPDDIQPLMLAGTPAIIRAMIRLLAQPDTTVTQIRQALGLK